MEKKWLPCFCTILLGIIVIVFAWWELSISTIILTIAGGLVILRGIINKCCCQEIACKTKEKAA
ncbi:MAG: hypothetical protein HQ555_01890 [Candidatus Aminicenantes bacterium]|nr:hypothetical protein [Candidatus Aminicenantes bacterium]